MGESDGQGSGEKEQGSTQTEKGEAEDDRGESETIELGAGADRRSNRFLHKWGLGAQGLV
jgi:hypothetical protein